MSVALLIVSHSAKLADGVAELAAQMAPDVHIGAAGGREDGGIGTSFDLIESQLAQALSGDREVVILTDLGSATMTAESVVEFSDEPERIRLCDAPLVEGAVAAAVSAQQGDSLDKVALVAQRAAEIWTPPSETITQESAGDTHQMEASYEKNAVIADKSGLHARPVAALARMAATYDAEVFVDDVPATSILGLMSLGKHRGDTVVIRATGSQAQRAVDDISRQVASGFDN